MSGTKNVGNENKCSLSGKKTDGFAVGKMTGVSIGTDGLIKALYSNGVQQNLGQICVGTFANAMGLENAGDNLYQVTASSGDVSVVGKRYRRYDHRRTRDVKRRPLPAVYRYDYNPERIPSKQPNHHNL